MAIRKSAGSGIPFGNTAGRPANPGIGQLYSNGQVGRLELYTETGWQNIVQETPGVASITGAYNESAGSGTFVLSGTNFVTGGIAYAVGTNGVEYQATTSTTNSIVQMTVTFTGLSAAYEPYDVKVLNPSNLFGLLPDAFFINDSPVWSTTAGSLGSIVTGQSASIQLAATDEESNSLSYSVSSGSLPGGLSLSSTGLISGTASGSTTQTFTFTVSVSDGSNTGQTRSFSIAYTAVPLVTGGTLASDSTYYYRTFSGTGNLSVSNLSLSTDVLIVAGGGGGGSGPAWTGPGGGGAGSILYKSGISLLGTYPITVGGGGAARNASSFNNASNGTDSSFDSVTALGGGGGGNGISHTQGNGANGGSGGGGTNGQPDGQSFPGGHLNIAANSGRPGGSAQSSVAGWTLHANAGGAGAADNAYNAHAGGGGGGAGQSGNTNQSAFHVRAGDGGNGVNTYSSWASATSTGSGGFYGGGGGGGTYSWPGDPDMTVSNWSSSFNSYVGHGGLGGGGNGGIGPGSYTLAPVNGSALTGGGAGAGGYQQTGASGGSGVVIIRYTKASVGG